MNPTCTLLRLIKTTGTAAILLGIAASASAQNCSVNAGGNATICGSGTTLTGSFSGQAGTGTPTWVFTSGPVTPVIATPNSLTTNVTGMTADGNYTFTLSQACGTGTAQSQVTITAHPKPSSFTAGPDRTSVCATTGTTTLAGVIPAGFTGQWRHVNIYSLNRYGTTETTNAQFSSATVATPTFSLINKADHEIDPSYYAILKITSNDGICTYEDTAVVRFIPNPVIHIPASDSRCISTSDPGHYFYLTAAPYFATNTPGAAGTGTTIVLNAVSQPAGANISFDKLDDNLVYLNGVTVQGTYVFNMTVTNSCGSYTTPNMTYVYSGTVPNDVSFQPAGHGAPEQLTIYSFAGSGGEVHCGIANTSTPENFYFSIDPADPATTITDVTPSGIMPPGGAPTVTVSGTGTYNRVATVTPPAGGWRVGTYSFDVYVRNASGNCGQIQNYYIHISDNNRPAFAMQDVSVCYPGNGAIAATVPLPARYQGVVNSSYLQDLPGRYNFTVLSKPAGASTPTFTTSNLRTIADSSTVIANLDKTGDYVFRMTVSSGGNSNYGPFLVQEYACSNINGTLQADFTIHVESLINANAGSDQNPGCTQSASLAGNASGAGTGHWATVSAPAGASPVFSGASSPITTVSGLTQSGTYKFTWTITTPLGGCISADTVAVDISCPLPVAWESFNATRWAGNVVLDWATAQEQNNTGFGIERSTNAKSWEEIGFVKSLAASGNSNGRLDYRFTDEQPQQGTNYYRIRLTDNDQSYHYSVTRQVQFDGVTGIHIYPNPATDYITVSGLNTGETISLYDATGKLLSSLKATGNNTSVDLQHFRNGIYQLVIITSRGDKLSKKLTLIR